MGTATPAELRPIDLFDELDDAALAEWAAAAVVSEFGPDEVVAEQDEVAGMQLLLEGEVRTLAFDSGRPEPVHRQVAPTWMGAIAALTGEPLAVRLQAVTRCRVALIETEEFRRLTFAHPVVHRRVMRQVAPVMGFLTSIERNRAILRPPNVSYLVDVLSGTDAWRFIDAVPIERGIVCGVADATRATLDEVEVMCWAMAWAAAGGRGSDRVGIAPNGSLARIDRLAAKRKIERLGETVRIASMGPLQDVAEALDPEPGASKMAELRTLAAAVIAARPAG